jgi:hypothetical protein
LNREKKPIKPIKILKKPANSVQFHFYKPKTKKTEQKPKKTKPNQKKIKANRKNQVKPEKPSQTSLNQFLS